MIETALFSWKHHTASMSLPHCLLWCGSVNYARKHFKNVVLVTDEKGKKLLVDGLNFPFTEVLEMPYIPDELLHIYDIQKLNAHLLMAQKNIPAVHIDYDAFLKKRLPPHLLEANFICEFPYEPKSFVVELNQKLPVPRLEKVELGYSAGIIGGCDSKGIENWSSKSIEIATDPRNREFLKKQNGYQAATLFGEIAAGTDFKNNAQFLLPRGHHFPEDYRSAGYIHLASLKKDHGVMAQAAIQVQISFPNEFMETGARFEELINY